MVALRLLAVSKHYSLQAFSHKKENAGPNLG